MKFKVGDKVKLVSMKNEDTYYEKYLGKIFTIEKLFNVTATFKEKTEENIAPYLYNLQKVKEKYTYDDLKKSPVGTKVTFENKNCKNILLKYELNKFINLSAIRDIRYLDNFKDNLGYLGKIIKIEEPKYTTVYESKPEILDETEKRYLRSVIRPFRDKVDYIVKQKSGAINKEYILIHFPNNLNISFPYFKPNTMYKGMALDKAYTLEELGL